MRSLIIEGSTFDYGGRSGLACRHLVIVTGKWLCCLLHAIQCSPFCCHQYACIAHPCVVKLATRLRARAAMLSGADLQQEGFWREESVRWFSAAVAGAPNDADALSAAGEGVLEYGR